MTAVQPGLFECLVGPEGRATIVDRRTWPCPWPRCRQTATEEDRRNPLAVCPKGHASKIRGQR